VYWGGFGNMLVGGECVHEISVGGMVEASRLEVEFVNNQLLLFEMQLTRLVLCIHPVLYMLLSIE
jgi:hypothetical protein